jgi:transcriptional regulator with XRE-family HTH domain
MNHQLGQIIQQYIKAKRVSIEQLLGLLHISKDSLYRRLRGENDFTLSEAYTLQNAFKFSLDSFNADYSATAKSFTIKKFPLYTSPEETVGKYIHELFTDLQKVGSAGLNQLYYAAKDLPLFCFFSSNVLTSFKLYFWYITIFDSKSKVQLYNPNWLASETLTEASYVYDMYSQCNSTEIWNFETINSTLHQLHYCREAGMLSKADAATIIAALYEFVNQLDKNCELGTKNGKGKLVLYLNEILLLDNSVIFDTNMAKIFYLPYQTLNFLSSTDAEFTDVNLQWFTKQISKSTLLTSDSQQARNRLMHHYKAEIIKYE